MTAQEELQNIFNTYPDIDVPADKCQDYFWLLRNFNKKNFNHPKRSLVLFLVKKILREELKK